MIRPFLLRSPMHVCLFTCKCVCVRERYGPFGQSHYLSTNQNRESVSCMSVYDDDDDLLISDAQQRVIDRLVSPSPLLFISAHSSLSTYRQSPFQTVFPPEIPVNYIKSVIKGAHVGKKINKLFLSTS